MIDKEPSSAVGFIGIGSMGEAMASNLIQAGHLVVVWNRTAEKCAALVQQGAIKADSAKQVFATCSTIFMMLADGEAMDAVLARSTPGFESQVKGRTIVNTATVPAEYSSALEKDIRAGGGSYVEAPVSGSRKPAEAGQLIAMLAGSDEAIARVRPLFASLSQRIIECGQPPSALMMKFAVNIFLIASVTGLAESANFAQSQGLDMKAWAAIVDESQMASSISKVKVAKLLEKDLSPQAAIPNVYESTRLIVAAGESRDVATPLMNVCLSLYRRCIDLQQANLDMISVVKAFKPRRGADPT